MPTRVTGTEPVSERDAGVPAKPHTDAHEGVGQPDYPVRGVLLPEQQHGAEAEQDERVPRQQDGARADDSASFAERGATRTMQETAGRIAAPACRLS